MAYRDVHRLFLQLMLQHRSLDEGEAVKLMKNCCKAFKEKVPQLDVFLQQINREVEVAELALRSTVEEREDSDYPCLVLVNLMAGEATRTLSTFSKNELSYIRLVVAEIIGAEGGELKMNVAVNLGLQLQPRVKASCCERLIERLVEEKWLLLSKYARGEVFVSLSGLAVAELNTYLEESHTGDNLKCFFCTKVTLKGYRCQECNITVHRDCVRKYWVTSRKRNACPGDKCTAFLGPPSPDPETKRRRMGEEEDMEEDMEEEEEVEEEGEEEEEEEEEDRGIQTRHGSRSGKGKGRKKIFVSTF